MHNDTRMAVDLAKSVFELAVSDRPGRVARRERLPRSQFLAFFAQQPAATVVMEACGSAHYWGRRIEQLGHKVTLLPPHHVRPYVRRNKTDRTDAKGILEASGNEDIRPVPVKAVAQQVLILSRPSRQGCDAPKHDGCPHAARSGAMAPRLEPELNRGRPRDHAYEMPLLTWARRSSGAGDSRFRRWGRRSLCVGSPNRCAVSTPGLASASSPREEE